MISYRSISVDFYNIYQMKYTIPYKFTPRDYQLSILDALDSGIKRAVCVWHRRAGKDKTGLNYMIKKMWEKKGVYYYFMPTYSQGRKIIWDGIDGSGFSFLEHFPKNIILRKNESEMKIILKNGSIFQIVGTDNINTVVGTNPIGCIFSEYSLQNPLAWDFIRPILRENKGWAVFLYTPRGHNHGYEMYNMALLNDDWFSEVLTVDDTKSITKEQIEADRAEGMDDNLIQQEYYCSFEGAMQGSYYGKQMKEALDDGRVTVVGYDESLKVNTAWDLGVGDATSIWFFQVQGFEVRLIDFYENSGEGLTHYVKILQDKKYIYDKHYAPHDIKVREFSTGKSRLETAAKLGINFMIVPNLPIEEGIDSVRRLFNKCWFDKEKTKHGVAALLNYHKEYDEKRMEFKNRPFHDWSSHASDAFRMLALGHQEFQLGSYGEDDKEIDWYRDNKVKHVTSNPLNPFET